MTTAHKRTPLAERFARYFVQRDATECWLWIASLDKDGYGLTHDDLGQTTRAHRASYLLFYGPIPPGYNVNHRCHNRRCINPHHLYAGTQADNVRDTMAAGRLVAPRGERNAQAKLSDAKVVYIRTTERAADELAREFNVTERTIVRARTGENWGHITIEAPSLTPGAPMTKPHTR